MEEIHQFCLNDENYLVLPCTQDDIPYHIDKVYSYWEAGNTDIEEQTLLLSKGVCEGTSWKVINSSEDTKAVIYCNLLTSHKAMSNLLWMENKRMLAILCYYLRMYVRLQYIYFMPHTKNFIPFKFLVQNYSIRLFHSHNQPLEIDLYSVKCENLYQIHFKGYNIQDIH